MNNLSLFFIACWSAFALFRIYSGPALWKDLLTTPEKIFLPVFAVLACFFLWNAVSIASAVVIRICCRRISREAIAKARLACPLSLVLVLELYNLLRGTVIPPVAFGWVKILYLGGTVLVSILFSLAVVKIASGRSARRDISPAGFGLPGAVIMVVFAGMFYLLFFRYGWSMHLFDNGPAERASEGQPNVVIITVDTLSATYSGMYGYEVDNTPEMEKIAAGGVSFDNTIAQIPVTGPSHASMMTGLYPRTLRRYSNFEPPIDEKYVTLARIFRDRGYQTAQFVNVIVCGAGYGLHRGFDTAFDNIMSQSPVQMLLNETTVFYLGFRTWRRIQTRLVGYNPVDENYAGAKTWINKRLDPPFFLWYHTYIPHVPYYPPAFATRDLGLDSGAGLATEEYKQIYDEHRQLSPERVEHITNAYVAEIYHADRIVGQLYRDIEKSGQLDNTIFIITADHGEEIYERDSFIGHAYYLNNAMIHVPLIVRYPSRIAPGARVNDFARLVDIFPTVLDLAGLDYDGDVEGESLMRLLDGKAGDSDSEDFVVSETFSKDEKHKFSIMRDGWQLLFREDMPDEKELYFRPDDPFERNNLIDEEIAGTLAPELETLFQSWNSKHPFKRDAQSGDADKGMKNKIKDLGYVH